MSFESQLDEVQPVDASKQRSISDEKKVRWPKIHLIYFFLALFDIFAVVSGLYLGHKVIGIYSETTARTEHWQRFSADARELQNIASDIHEMVINALDSTDLAALEARLLERSTEFDKTLNDLRQAFDHKSPNLFEKGVDIHAQAHDQIVHLLDQVTVKMKHFHSRAPILATLDQDQEVSTLKWYLITMQRDYREVREFVGEVIEVFVQAERGHTLAQKKQIVSLQRFEYLIGAMIVIMVLFIATYGHFVGRLIKRKYHELEVAHEKSQSFARELEGVNAEVVTLNRKLANNIQKLKEAQEEIIRKGRLAQLGQLVATVAHDIRNPLSAIRTAVAIIERRLGKDNPDFEKPLMRIDKGVERCDTIVSELLDFSRSGYLQVENLVLDDWLVQQVEEHAEKLPAAVSIECNLKLDNRKVSFDPSRLQRALINFLTNASEAMVGKGDKPEEQVTQSPKIIVSSQVTKRGIEIAVSDNGPGMSQEILEKVLEPLFTTKSYGVGLGLPAVEKIFEQHRGGMEIVSEEGFGTTITGWLPISRLVDNSGNQAA